MLRQERCDDLVRLIDQLSPIVGKFTGPAAAMAASPEHG